MDGWMDGNQETLIMFMQALFLVYFSSHLHINLEPIPHCEHKHLNLD